MLPLKALGEGPSRPFQLRGLPATLGFLGLQLHLSTLCLHHDVAFLCVLTLSVALSLFLLGHQSCWLKGQPCSGMTSS